MICFDRPYILELTDEEINIILEHRKKIAEERRIKSESLETLRVSYEFEKWLQEHNASASYTTFCDEFAGYQGDYRSELYSAYLKISKIARELVGAK